MRWGLTIIGQSGARGRICTVTKLNQERGFAQFTRYAPPARDPIYPGVGAVDTGSGVGEYGGWWCKVADDLKLETGIDLYLNNMARGGTSIVEDWVSTDDNTVTGVVQAEGDGNFDHQGWLAEALSYSNARNVDRRLIAVCIGISDALQGTPAASFQTAYENLAAYFMSRGHEVILGLDNFGDKSYVSAWPGLDAALTAAVQASGAHLGPNLHQLLGEGLYTWKYDSNHLHFNGNMQTARFWTDTLKALV